MRSPCRSLHNNHPRGYDESAANRLHDLPCVPICWAEFYHQYLIIPMVDRLTKSPMQIDPFAIVQVTKKNAKL